MVRVNNINTVLKHCKVIQTCEILHRMISKVITEDFAITEIAFL